MVRRKKTIKVKRYGEFLVPKKMPYQYKKLDNYLSQIYRLNKDKVDNVYSEETGEPLTRKQFIADLKDRIRGGQSVKEAVTTLSRTEDYLDRETRGFQNIRKTLRGNKEFKAQLETVNSQRKAQGLKPLRQKDFNEDNFYFDPRTGNYINKTNSSIQFKFNDFSKDNPYSKGKALIKIWTL